MMPRKKGKFIDQLGARLADILHDLEVIEAEIDATQTRGDLDETVTLFAALRGRQDQVKRLSAKLAKLSDTMSFETLPDIFNRTNTLSPYKHVLGKCTLATRTNASCREGLKEEGFAWLRKNGLGSIIIETIPWQTFGATAADLIKEGRELPDALFEVTNRTYTRFTPAGKKEE